MSLAQLAGTDEPSLPARVMLVLDEVPPPDALENLRKLEKLGILHSRAVFSLLAQAPIDPINLVGTLMRLLPDGWVFSAFDFSMMRVLSRSPASTVHAAMHVDLMGDTIKFLALSKGGKLSLYKEYKVVPDLKTWDVVQALICETVEAAAREAHG